MALDIKKIIKQEAAKIMLEQHLLEAETPDHFGGGKNIDVFGYQTEHFDICKSAVMLFTKLKEKNLEGMAVEHAKKAAEHIDKVFGIEKDVVEEGSAAPEQMEEAVDNNMLFGYEIGGLAMHIDEDLTRDTAFHKLHIMEIANRFQGDMSGNVTESINEAPMDKRFAKEYEKSGKALRNHIKHEMGKGTVYTANQKRELQKLDQIIKLAMNVPNNMAKIIDEPGKVRTESKINEISTKAGLEDVIKGRTSAIEGIKMSKDLAQGMMDFINRSPYGRKYGKQIMKGRIASLIGPANAFGIERYLSPKAKKEFKAIYKKHGPKREVKEAAPGYMHDCASKVIHKEHGAGTCIPEQHNLVKEGKKWVVTKYDVKFDSGKIVRNVPVNELKIVTESHHGHKRRKKKKTEYAAMNKMSDYKKKQRPATELEEAKIKKGSIVIAKIGPHKGEKHKVIHDFGDGRYNIQPLGFRNKYRMGAAGANEKELRLVKETSIREKIANLTPKQKAELKEKLVFYRDKKDRLRRFDTDKAANKRLSR